MAINQITDSFPWTESNRNYESVFEGESDDKSQSALIYRLRITVRISTHQSERERENENERKYMENPSSGPQWEMYRITDRILPLCPFG